MQQIAEEGGVLLTTYGLVKSSHKVLNVDEDFTWDYIILDEGHKIKNHTREIAKACRKINTTNRIILSGTPIQNNLLELWSLFDFVGFGNILGRIKVWRLRVCVHKIAAIALHAL